MFKRRNWLIHNVKVTLIRLLENFSHQKIWVARSLHSDKIIVVDDGWGISLTFSTVTVKQLEIAQVVLSEVSSSDSNEQKIKAIYL